MEMSLNVQERPDVSAEQRGWRELAKLIRKLRWIGMEEEAKKMQMELVRVHPAPILLLDPFATD